MSKREYDSLEKLTDLDDRAVEEISAKYPALDEAAFKRIEKLCERKMKMNINNTNAIGKNGHSDYVEGVERIKHIPFYRRPAFAACASIALVVAVGTTLLLNLRNTGDGPDIPTPPPVIATGSVTGKTTNVATSTTSVDETTTSADNSGAVGSGANTDVTTEPVTENATDSGKHSVTNGYDIADHPEYLNYLKDHYSDQYYESYSYALYDINNDSAPELIIYFDAEKQTIHEIRDTELNSYVRSNMSAISYLCDGGTVLALQGDPPYMHCTYLHPLSGGMSDRFECLTFRGVMNVENGKFIIESSGEFWDDLYHYVPTESERYGSDSFIQSELDIQTPSEGMKITPHEAEQFLTKYSPLTIETDRIGEVFGE